MTKARRSTVTVLLSGGIDSTACTHFYLIQNYQVQPLFFHYGQPAALSEAKSARAVCAFYKLPFRMVRIEGLKVAKSGEIVGRNLVFVSTALMYVGFKTNLVALGIHAGAPYFDCSRRFMHLCDRAFEGYSDGRVGLGAPFLRMNKGQIWSYCRQNHIPVHLTWSCEARSATPCRKCRSCRDKEALFAGA
jgi:7-cyano-7-deazaguanine synthase